MSLPNAPSLLIRGSSQHLHDSRQRRIEVIDRGKGSKGKNGPSECAQDPRIVAGLARVKPRHFVTRTPPTVAVKSFACIDKKASPPRVHRYPRRSSHYKRLPPTRVGSEGRLPAVVPRPSFSRGVPPPIPQEAPPSESSSDSEDEFYKKFMKRRRQTVVTKEKPRGRLPDRRRVDDELVITIKPWERPDAVVPVYGLLGSIGKRESAMKPARVDRTPTRGGKADPQVAEE
ncbi:hypothetical protein FOZ61_001701 [Perkinsus olseni]|uniref:Uncharacterized protein n=1 Tax=Perkinsus olseni TaxID=32597 RepID=A0A7J6LVQ4_PEROL|nr:hypothetical protein FOZ61_001701 [Perkinsus olseni]KAF4669049.1 hypothetical protein FOL46_001638 [Perkinsus olseni]